MDAAEIRAAFQSFTGPDRYREFVRTVNRGCRRKGRLFFWQEELWRIFVANTPGIPASEEHILETFCVCDVHGCSLEVSSGQEAASDIRHTPEFDRAVETVFPLATGGDWVCTRCQSERQRWIAENPELCRILRCQTTYEAYCHRQFELIIDPISRDDTKRQAEDGIRKMSAEIAAQMQPGDELWEWDGGGWHQLSGRGGVAIVRDGKIVQQWCLCKS